MSYVKNGSYEPMNESKVPARRGTPYSRGAATSFGFKRRPGSASCIPTPNNAITVTYAADNVAENKTRSVESLTSISPLPSGRSTPRLPRGKKDADGNTIARPNRFGFRPPSVASITNKVADLHFNNKSVMVTSHATSHSLGVTNAEKPRAKGGGKLIASSALKLRGSSASVVSDGNNKNYRSNIPHSDAHLEQSQASKFTLQTSHLPKPQFPIRMASIDNDTSVSKTAKTAVNNTRKVSHGSAEESSSKESSVNEDSGIASQQGANGNGETDTLHGIEQLETSPTFGYRRNIVKPRPMEVIVNGNSFDVRDLKDSSMADDPNVITEISLISIPTTKQSVNMKLNRNTGLVRERSLQYQRQALRVEQRNNTMRQQHTSTATNSSDEGHDDEGLGCEEEEKLFRDSSNNEKKQTRKESLACGVMEDDWGHGEAMAEEYSSSSDDSINQSRKDQSVASPPVTIGAIEKSRPVLLLIEDPRFAAIAAAASETLIDDEKSPNDTFFSNSPPTSTASEDVSDDGQPSLLQKDNIFSPDGDGLCDITKQSSGNTLSPNSPGTPTNASNSLSLSEGRDFLIDDEIADQPGLTFADGGPVSTDLATSSGGCSSQLLSITDNTMTIVDSSPKPALKRVNTSIEESPVRVHRVSRAGSVDTLSPCESIASDDLMLDFERSEGSALDSTMDSHLDGSIGAMHHLDEATIMLELEAQGSDVMREWSSLLGAHRDSQLGGGRLPRLLRSRAGSTPESPRSLDSKPRTLGSPLRPPRQSSVCETEDGGMRIDRATYQYMFQDIVNIKTMLLKLKRVLQEAETLNPFDSSLKNGLFYTLANSEASIEEGDGSSERPQPQSQEEVADLRRQVVFLQQQLEEKERTIQVLQVQAAKQTACEVSTESGEADSCNAATQTERIRPVSAGPSLLQSLPSENNMGPLVSLTDTWSRRPRPVLGEVGGSGGSGVTACKLPAPATTGSSKPCKRTSLPSTFPQPGATVNSSIPTRKPVVRLLPSRKNATNKS